MEALYLQQEPGAASRSNAATSGARRQQGSTPFLLWVGIFQLLLVVLYGVSSTYGYGLDPDTQVVGPWAGYPMYQDVHMMIFVGFGFLMTFLSRYAWGSVGFNLLIAAMVIQWAIFIRHFWDGVFEGFHGKFGLHLFDLLTADFAAAAVLITMGAVVGRVSALQLFFIGIVEVVFFGLNEAILVFKVKASDIGGSMVVHVFGAYFGLALSRTLHAQTHTATEPATSKTNSLFSMVGTIILWVFWPSFVAGPAAGDEQQRAVLHTVLSICASTLAAFIASKLLRNGKFCMEDVQNATLAGGVAIGTVADFVLGPWAAILIGLFAGLLSTFGFARISPWLNATFGLEDTCGVHNLHGMPGVLGGLAGVIGAAAATSGAYGASLTDVFPERGDDGRTAGAQAGAQLLALLLTLVIAIGSGVGTGFLVRLLGEALTPYTPAQMFNDKTEWDMDEVDPDYEKDAVSGAAGATEPQQNEHVTVAPHHQGGAPYLSDPRLRTLVREEVERTLKEGARGAGGAAVLSGGADV